MLFYKTEEITKNGKYMLKVTDNMKNIWLGVGILVLLLLGIAFIFFKFTPFGEIGAVVVGLFFGVVIGLAMRKEKKELLSRQKPGTEIIMEPPVNGRPSNTFYIELR